MKRRDIVVGVIAGVAATALVFEARAQQPGRTYRIALLALFRPQPGARRWYLEELERNGFVEGQNLVLDDRGMGVPVADLQATADRLVKAGPDLFMAWGPAAAHAAQHATMRPWPDPSCGSSSRSCMQQYNVFVVPLVSSFLVVGISPERVLGRA